MNLPFQIGLGQGLCLLALLGVTAFELLANRRGGRKPARAHEERRTGPFMLLMAIGGFGGGFALSREARAFWSDPFAWWQYLGFVLVAAGLGVRSLAFRSLGEAFTLNPGVSAGQQLVTAGIYRRIRHPAYLGTLLLFAGMAWIFAHPLASALALLLPALGLVLRIRVEEDLLARAFGEQYRVYQRQTKRFVPFVF